MRAIVWCCPKLPALSRWNHARFGGRWDLGDAQNLAARAGRVMGLVCLIDASKPSRESKAVALPAYGFNHRRGAGQHLS